MLYDKSAVNMCLLCTGGNYEESSCASGSIDSSRTPNKAWSTETPIKPFKPERPVRQGRTQHFFGLSSSTTGAIQIPESKTSSTECVKETPRYQDIHTQVQKPNLHLLFTVVLSIYTLSFTHTFSEPKYGNSIPCTDNENLHTATSLDEKHHK